MKLRALLALVLLSSCRQNRPREWVNYIPDDSAFSISIPKGYSKGHFRHAEFDGAGNYLSWRIPELLIADMDVKLMELSYVDIRNVRKMYSDDQLLDSSMNYLAGSFVPEKNGRITSSEKIMLDSFRGRSFAAVVNVNKDDSLNLFIKKYLVGNRIYTVYVNAYKTPMNQKVVDSFMNSFRIRN